MRLTLQLHPDRPAGRLSGGVTVIEALARDGVYRSQFTTGTSNGALSAHAGGERWRWESRLFAGRYDAGPAVDRPVYGAWDRHHDPHGGSARFGSAYLVLHDDCTARSTYCYPDSWFEPDLVGGPDLLQELCAAADAAMLDGCIDRLDDYVEAQVHGPVMMARDVVAVVLDPCFRDSDVHAAASRLGPPVTFHPGFRLATDRLAEHHVAYRSPEAVALARAWGGVLQPDRLTHALAGGADPTVVKHVWHLLARFGRSPEAGLNEPAAAPPG